MLTPISNEPRAYSWGAADLIARLQGRTAEGVPEAEVWFGDHPGSPSLVGDGSGATLDVLLERRGDEPLTYLLKILAAGMSLSIQAHPSKAQAEAGFAREEAAGIPRAADDRTYRDDNHKPEIIVALSETFSALVGLRSLEASRRLVAALGDGPHLRELSDRLNGDDEPTVLRDVLDWALSGAAQATVDEVTAALRATVDEEIDEEFAAEFAVLRRIADDFPSDSGILVALLMNLVTLRRGEALFAPAGVLHAYQDGLGVELMAASDNVLRGGLTPKHIDVDELLRIVDTTPGAVPIVATREVDGVTSFDVDIPDFSLVRVASDGDEKRMPLRGAAIVLATAGEVTLATASASCTLLPGQAAFLSADEREVRLTGVGECFVAQPGRVATVTGK